MFLFKKIAKYQTLFVREAIDEALCLGWVDRKSNKQYQQSFYLYFSQKKKKANWRKVSKDKVERLIETGKMALPVLEIIELAKATGTWDDSNEVDELMEPRDHFEEFSQNSIVFQFWKEVPLLPRKRILEWIYKVKTENIRLKRIQARIKLAEKNL